MKQTLKEHLCNERLQRINRAWKYLSWKHRAGLFVLAIWWSLPNVIEIRERIQDRFIVWITYKLYKAHWIRTGQEEN